MNRRHTRREVLRWTGFGMATIVVPALGFGGYIWATADQTNIGSVEFNAPLAIPPLVDSLTNENGSIGFDLNVRSGETEILPGTTTATWGINEAFLGPTIRVRRGDTVAPRVFNGLHEPTTLHWHGLELPAFADGGPHQLIEPGATWEPEWTIDQAASTFWYHPHPHGRTKEHVYRGVAGLFIVDDDSRHGLPQTYGVDDIPIILQDKKMNDDGEFLEDGIGFGGLEPIGLLGSTILINGTWGPYLEVTTTLLRLRILNASNARIYDLVFDDRRLFHVVGSDSGLLPAPAPVDHLQISPGERFEIVVALTPGETVLLKSQAPSLGSMFVIDRLSGGDDVFDLLELRAAPILTESTPLPSHLPAQLPIVPSSDTVSQRFFLGEFSINGTHMDMNRVDFVVPLGETQIWEVRNDQDNPHNLHVHNATFQILEIDGDPPPPALSGFKDTVYAPPGKTIRFAVRFGQHVDSTLPFMVHCHLLAHEDAGMMLQFVMVEADAAASMTVPFELIPGHYHRKDP